MNKIHFCFAVNHIFLSRQKCLSSHHKKNPLRFGRGFFLHGPDGLFLLRKFRAFISAQQLRFGQASDNAGFVACRQVAV